MKKRLVKALIASAVMSSLMITTVFATPSVDELKNQKAATENEVNDLHCQWNIFFYAVSCCWKRKVAGYFQNFFFCIVFGEWKHKSCS